MQKEINMDLKNFAKAHRKKSSVFDDYKEDIIYLLNEKVSQENMLLYIKKKSKGKITRGLTQGNLSQYLKRLCND